MNQEYYAQLTEGYEAALDALGDFQSCLTDLHDSLSDALMDLHGEIAEATAALTASLKVLHRIQAGTVVGHPGCGSHKGAFAP